MTNSRLRLMVMGGVAQSGGITPTIRRGAGRPLSSFLAHRARAYVDAGSPE